MNEKIESFWRSRAYSAIKGELGLLQSSMFTETEQEAKERDIKEKTNLLRLASPYIRGRVLELGCGTGRMTRWVAPFVSFIDAYDYNENYITLARQLTFNPNVRYHCRSAETISPNGTYDCVLSSGLFCYLTDEQAMAVAEIIRASLRLRGHVVFRESVGFERFELHNRYSPALKTEYNAIYRTVNELSELLGCDFNKIVEEITFQKWPETCQKVVVYERYNLSGG